MQKSDKEFVSNVKLKNNFWQIIRGICILAVVLIHCPGGALYGIGSKEFTIWMILRQCINFPVAIFIFLSGYFTSIEWCKSNYKAYVIKRSMRLIIPFIIWSGFYSALTIIRTISSYGSVNWPVIIVRFIVGKASTPLYYIVVLVQLTMLTPIFIKIICKGGVLSKLLWALTPVYLIYIYGYNIMLGNTPSLYETLFPAWFMFYYLGLNMKMSKEIWQKIIEKYGRWSLVFAALILSLIESTILIYLGCDSNFASSQIKTSSFLYAGCLILFLCNRNKKTTRESKLIKTIGDYSYCIFYIHSFIIMVVEKMLYKIGATSMWGIYFTATWLLAISISYGIAWCVNKIPVKSNLGYKILIWGGFQ